MILSIIVPMYKVEAFVEKCLLSCESQEIDEKEFEIIVVNDGSPDKSLEVAEAVACQFNNIKIFSQENGGLSAARNTGIDKAAGDYLFFVDSDDWIATNSLKKICNTLAEKKPDVLAICAANVFGEKICRRFSFEGLTETTGPESLRHIVSRCAPFLIVKRRHLMDNNIRFYPGIFHEDSEYTPRMLYSANRVVYINDVIYYVYQNPNSITRTTNPKKLFDVLSVVAPHLYTFSQEKVSRDYKYIFDNLVCEVINSSLYRNLNIDKDAIIKANDIFNRNKHLTNAFLRSNHLKYKVEGILLQVFPRYLIQVYKIMNVFRR